MAEIYQFISAVFSTWIEKVGIALTILPFIEKIPVVRKWLTQKPVLEKFVPLLWIIGIVCIFWGFFSAWQEQFKTAQALQERLKSPDLQFQFSNTFWADRDGRLMLITSGIVTNPHGPDSAAINWQMTLELPFSSHSKMQGMIMPRPKEQVAPHGANVIFVPSDYWPEKTADPIRSGAAVSGWVWCVFPFTSEDFRSLGTTALVVSFDDVVSGKTHYARQEIRDTGKGVDLFWKPQQP